MRRGALTARRRRRCSPLARRAGSARTSSTSFNIVLTEGRNRQIRRMCQAIGFTVTALRRTEVMGIGLTGLQGPGEWTMLPESERSGIHAAIEGAAQRVHEDTQRFAAGIQSCVAVVLQSIFTLVVFCPVLYDLDPQLMLIAVAAAVGGLSISALVGWPLVDLEIQNQVVEADLRKRLVLLEADPVTITTTNASDESLYSSFAQVFRMLTRNYRRLYLSFFALSTWLALYEQTAVILPYILVAPRLFAANSEDQLTLGQLVKVSNSFCKVFDSLNVVSDSWLQINEFRSCLRRLREFEREMNSKSPGAPARLVAAHVELSDSVSSTSEPWVHRVDPV